MRHFKVTSAICCFSAFGIALISPLPASAQGNIAAPAGWSRSVAGGDVVISQAGSASRLVVKALVPIGNDENSWFVMGTERDAANRGEPVSDGTTSRKGVIRSLIRKYESNGRTQSVAYIGYTTRGMGRLCIFSAASDRELSKCILAMGDYLKQLGDYDNDPSNKRPATTTTRPVTAKRPTVAANKAPLKPMNTANRGTLKSNQIMGIYLDESYGVGVGGGVIIQYEPVLLLRDGSARRNLEIPPLDLNVAKDKATAKKDWGRWSKRGAKYVVRWTSGSEDEIKPNFKVLPGRPGESLPGKYSTIGGGGNTAMGGDMMIYYSNNYNFGRDGRFTGGSSAGGGNSGVTTLSQSKNAGRYRIDGYALTLQYNDGRQVRRLFYFYPDGKSDGKRADVIGIGDSAYTNDD